MKLAVMTRASRSRTGRESKASRTTIIGYALLVLAALVRPMADIVPDHNEMI